MSRRAFVLRPEPGCRRTAMALEAQGIAVSAAPLFRIRPREWNAPDPTKFDGLLLGSANAIRHGGEQLFALRSLPVHAVGAATAAAARKAGFAVAGTGQGGLQALLDQLAGQEARLLRLAGAERVDLSPPRGVTIEERVVYETVPTDLPRDLEQNLRDGGVVLLHSAGAAKRFAQMCEARELDRSKLALAAMGPRVASAAGEGWSELRSAAQPSEAALLALAVEMCN